MRIGKILGVWAVIASLLFWNGVLAIGVLKPLLGREAGEMMSMFIGMTIIAAAARTFLLAEPEQPRPAILRISVLWLVLTLTFEVGLGRVAQLTVPARTPLYGMWDGSFWPLIVLSVTIAPFVWLQRAPVAVGRVTK
jgi:hypothetical protein